ncbi:MAG: 50S ribosomal protein L31e [Candidatus ainarchaeum sp.]|nr:50S ribosomal protein L31e [Candidatus ainarchaeum sp.]
MAKAKPEKKTVKIEREIIVPLVKAYEKPRTKRAAKAINILKAFMKKHFRVSEEKVLVSNAVNELIWSRGIEHVPRKIKVKAVFEEENLRVLLPGEKLPEKKAKKEEKKAVEKKTKEQVEQEKEAEKKKEEKKEAEKEAEKMSIKRGTQ